jgi:hypothetical protein
MRPPHERGANERVSAIAYRPTMEMNQFHVRAVPATLSVEMHTNPVKRSQHGIAMKVAGLEEPVIISISIYPSKCRRRRTTARFLFFEMIGSSLLPSITRRALLSDNRSYMVANRSFVTPCDNFF